MRATLPKVAERHFSLLCGEAGVTCNSSSSDDSAGWDFIVQFQPDPADRRALDEQPGGEAAFVQVKSTNSPPFAVQLKLSNALRMAKERTPYFLVLVVDGAKGRRFLARHFWVAEIESTLRRVRQAEASGHRDRLNKKKLTLTMSDADDRTDGLLDWMRSTVRSVSGQYHVAKSAIADTVGYEGSGIRLSMSLTGSFEQVVDWQLGLASNPPVSKFRLTRERFGIELEDPAFAQGELEVSIQPVGRECLVALRPSGDAPAVNFVGKLYVSGTAGLEAARRAWRVDLGFLSLVGRAGRFHGHLRLDFAERLALPRLKERLAVAGWPGTGPIGATVFSGGERWDIGSLGFPADAEGREWRDLAQRLATVERMSDAHPGQVTELSVADLMDAGVWLKRFDDLLTSKSMRIEHSSSLDDDPTRALIYFLRCDVGPWGFVAVVRREVAHETSEGGRTIMYLSAAQLLEAMVLKGSWRNHVGRIAASYARHVAAMGDPTFFWDLGDIEEWLAKNAPEDR